MKNIYKSTGAMLLLCLCHFVQAQETDSTTFYRHHIGLIASPVLNKLFTNNRELPIGIIYKRQTKANAAMRASLMASHDSYKFTSRLGNPDDYDKVSTNFIQLTAGYEWQQNLGRRWLLYYGAEAGPFLSREVQDEFSFLQTDSGDAIYTLYAVDETRGVVLRTFAGLALKISKRFYFATETAILAQHQRRESDTKKNVRLISSGEVLSGEHGSGIWRDNSVKYQPLSNISILWRF